MSPSLPRSICASSMHSTQSSTSTPHFITRQRLIRDSPPNLIRACLAASESRRNPSRGEWTGRPGARSSWRRVCWKYQGSRSRYHADNSPGDWQKRQRLNRGSVVLCHWQNREHREGLSAGPLSNFHSIWFERLKAWLYVDMVQINRILENGAL